MDDALVSSVGELVRSAADRATSDEARRQLQETAQRLAEPLRLAIAGKVKAGKSTLLNALLGEELAPTDAGECTKIVTWYRYGDRPTVVLHPREGEPETVFFSRDGGALETELGGRAPGDVERLEVWWPTSRLRDVTLIDTPGIESISTDLSARTLRVLTPDDDRPPVVDAVLYLLRHAHASDVRFLESFHDDELAHGTPMNAVGVLSRADEIGSCRLDALDVAARVAHRYQAEPRLRRLCPVIVPVAGLLGHAAVTFREPEYRALAKLATAVRAETDALLLTADRFAARPSTVPVTELEREHLLARLGLYGVRLCVELIRSGAVQSATDLAAQLAVISGLDNLRHVLLRQFTDRSRVLQAHSALTALESVIRSGGCSDVETLRVRADQIVTGAHAFEEVRVLDRLRTGGLQLREEHAAELDRLLGGSGHDPATRLGLAPGAGEAEIRSAALQLLGRWQLLAEHPLSSREVQVAARGASRTLEGIVVATSRRF